MGQDILTIGVLTLYWFTHPENKKLQTGLKMHLKMSILVPVSNMRVKHPKQFILSCTISTLQHSPPLFCWRPIKETGFRGFQCYVTNFKDTPKQEVLKSLKPSPCIPYKLFIDFCHIESLNILTVENAAVSL